MAFIQQIECQCGKKLSGRMTRNSKRELVIVVNPCPACIKGPRPAKSDGLRYPVSSGMKWTRLQKISINQHHVNYLLAVKWWIEEAPQEHWEGLNAKLDCNSFSAARKAFAWLENSGEYRQAIAKFIVNFCKPKDREA